MLTGPTLVGGRWHLGGTQGGPTPSAPVSAYGFDQSATFNSNAEWLDPETPPLDPECPTPRSPPSDNKTKTQPYCARRYTLACLSPA